MSHRIFDPVIIPYTQTALWPEAEARCQATHYCQDKAAFRIHFRYYSPVTNATVNVERKYCAVHGLRFAEKYQAPLRPELL